MHSNRDHTFSHALRLSRASHHLHNLENQVREWLGQDPYYYVTVPDPQSDMTTVRVRFTIPPPAEFRLIIGDCLHNLRSALDNLVYQLAVQNTAPNPIPEDKARELAFPIVSSPMKPDEFMTKYRSRIGLLDPGAQAIIEELQPYHREDGASHPLWKLNKLSNIDKHRVPHIASLALVTYTTFPDAPTSLHHFIINAGPIEDSAIIARYAPNSSRPEADQRLNNQLRFGIAFSQESNILSGDVIIALRWLYNHVANRMVPRLEPYLSQ